MNKPTQTTEAHRHLYHPWWSVKEMEIISELAHKLEINPVELIRHAVGLLAKSENEKDK